MKKIISLLLCTVLVMSVFTACGKKEAEGLKTGLGVVFNAAYGSSDASADKDGTAEVDSTVVAVLVDNKGVIKDCVIDVIQPKFNFSATGEITTDLSTEFTSKKELGDNYQMKGSSGIGKEWYEQAEALENYVIGKTIDEVKGIAIDEGGHPTSEDLTSSVTISISDIIDAIEKAVNNAKDLGAKAGDKLGLGITAAAYTEDTKNATADGDGSITSSNTYCALTLDSNGKITSSIIDAGQPKVTFNAEGKITSDLNGTYQTKLELGDNYNMKGVSGIGKEWYEQSQGFCEYMKGKTIADITGIALDDRGAATNEDVLSSVTISISDFLKAVEKAGAAAK